jgi:hypothetical protein
MQTSEKANLIDSLRKGTVTVTFQKIDSDEVRVMPCTLNPVILEANGVDIKVDKVSPESDNIAVWSLDKNAWRSFRTNTVLGWEVL